MYVSASACNLVIENVASPQISTWSKIFNNSSPSWPCVSINLRIDLLKWIYGFLSKLKPVNAITSTFEAFTNKNSHLLLSLLSSRLVLHLYELLRGRRRGLPGLLPPPLPLLVPLFNLFMLPPWLFQLPKLSAPIISNFNLVWALSVMHTLLPPANRTSSNVLALVICVHNTSRPNSCCNNIPQLCTKIPSPTTLVSLMRTTPPLSFVFPT